ncbi:PQQ-binding-like beta-propeller repeat protein [Candidatus Uabimicrobium sp. HlEnr_7]|uniref:outer membrane protein assembly factor BamB family protein n=1 Tax=Candidatus Uabimicrobium helgolandensis TaxID=3095367 RepID=UPI003556150C
MKKAMSFIILCSLSLCFSDDWPKWRGEASTGVSQEKNILTSWPKAGLKTLWKASLGSGYSGISVANGRVFTLYGDSDYENAVALDAKTGKVLWKKRLGYLFKNYFGDGPRSTPTVDGNKVYVISSNGDLQCLSTKNGRKYWGMNVLKKFIAKNIDWGMSGSPFIVNDLLLYNPGGKKGSIIALDKNTGKLKWTSGNFPAGYSTPITATIGGIFQVIMFTGDHIVGFLPQNGKIIWKSKWVTDYNVNAATPIFHNNHVFISSGYRSGSALIKLTVNDGKISARKLWTTKKMKNHFSSSILHNNHIYGFHQTRLKCMDFQTGSNKWTQSGFQKGSLVGVNNHMIILGEKGGLAIAELIPGSYKQKGFMPLFKGTKCWTVPTIANGQLYVRNESQMVCLDVSK